MDKPANREFGVLYFCDDNPAFQRMAAMSVESLRRFHPDWPVELVRVPSTRIPLWKKTYRLASFWKRQRRHARAGQDKRIIANKAEIMLATPFRLTLYLDVDTIVMRPLDRLLELARSSDVVVTRLPWKRYRRVADWQPESWPFVMAGVMFHSRRFNALYRGYIERFGSRIIELPTSDQIVVSLACHMEADNLKISYEPDLQIDVLNLAQHLGTDEYPRVGEYIDLRHGGLRRFHIFHYNEYKPQYMQQIRDVWGIEG